jgi:hypothetical protein
MPALPEAIDQCRARERPTNPRLYFSIYYKLPNDDGAFVRAAKTWEAEIYAKGFERGRDLLVSAQIFSETQFSSAWLYVNENAKASGSEVVSGQIFSHASKGDALDGLEFAVSGQHGEFHTVSRSELASLPRLPWAKEGFLILAGCNTGRVGTRGWCPAAVFASAQGVRTLGQVGYSYFSSTWQTYAEATPRHPATYLWAYHRRRNGFARRWNAHARRSLWLGR